MTKIQKYIKKDGSAAYEFNVYLGKTDNGKNIYRRRRGFANKKQAQIALSKIIEEYENNGLSNKPTVITFKDAPAPRSMCRVRRRWREPACR